MQYINLFRNQQLTSQAPRNLSPNEAPEGIPPHTLPTHDCSSLLHREDTVVALLSSIPDSQALGGFASWQSCASGRRVLYILNSLCGIPSMSCICWNYLLKEAHANTWFHPILQRRFNSQLQDTALPSVVVQHYGFTISFLGRRENRKYKIIF